MEKINKILNLLSSKERKNFYWLTLMILIMAFLEMVGVASIIPFIAVLSNPDIVDTNFFLKNTFQILNNFGIENKEQFLLILGIFSFIFLIFSISFKALTLYSQARLTSMCEYSIGKRLVENYLRQPYSWFLNRNSSSMGSNILSEVALVINFGLTPFINLIAQSSVTLVILTLLILTDPKLALIVGITLGTSYGLIYKIINRFLSKISTERFEYNQLRYKIISETFGAIKEIKLKGSERTYIDNFSEPAKILSKHKASGTIIGQMPRLVLELVVFGGMFLLIFYLMSMSGNFVNIVPVIALYAFAGYRLMPALQKVYAAITHLRLASPPLKSISDDLNNPNLPLQSSIKNNLTFNKEISLKNINYSYPKSSLVALENINLRIPFKSIVGIVGSTGSGKTTLVDIILNLLEPNHGTLEVDGSVINKDNYRAWQKLIGYVPQQIYLADDTIASNIAFGVNKENINYEAVKNAAKISNLHDFINNDLPLKYQTEVGERGVRLSGGQRQRIGIARALYHNPKIVVLDEATNALDSLTEAEVMKAVQNLKNKVTIILITHRINSVKQCDNIFLLEKGKLISEGSYNKLFQTSQSFQKIASNL